MNIFIHNYNGCIKEDKGQTCLLFLVCLQYIYYCRQNIAVGLRGDHVRLNKLRLYKLKLMQFGKYK